MIFFSFLAALVLEHYHLLTDSNRKLKPTLEKLRPGARVVSHNYEIPGWEEKKVLTETVEDENGENHYIYLYVR